MKILLLVLAYNNEKYIERLLDSIFSQKIDNYDIVINDDCSTDKTFDVIITYIYSRNIESTVVKIFKSPINLGINATILNYCNTFSNHWVKIIAGDDEFSENALASYCDLTNEYNCNRSLIMSGLEVIDQNSKTTEFRLPPISCIYTYKFLKEVNLYVNLITAPSIILGRINLINALLSTSAKNAEDWPISRYFMSHNMDIICINKFLVKYRVHADSLSVNYSSKTKTKINPIKLDVLKILRENLKISTSPFSTYGIWVQYKYNSTNSYIFKMILRVIKLFNLQYLCYRIIILNKRNITLSKNHSKK